VEVEDSGHAAADPSVYVERRKKGTWNQASRKLCVVYDGEG
jgi:hypothetical protein